MSVQKNQDEERAARIDMILEELRLNTEDLHELAKQARVRAITTHDDVRSTIADAQTVRQAGRAGKKR
jgi:hypothetical protein